jgi:hypothetical protein
MPRPQFLHKPASELFSLLDHASRTYLDQHTAAVTNSRWEVNGKRLRGIKRVHITETYAGLDLKLLIALVSFNPRLVLTLTLGPDK